MYYKKIIANDINQIKLFEKIIKEQENIILEFLSHSNKNIFITGVGKSALVAEIISSGLRSVGIKSHFIHSSDALHGEMAVFQKGDSCICISHSGMSGELVDFSNYLKNRKILLLLFTSSNKPEIKYNYLVNSGVSNESLSLIDFPSASTIIALICGQIITEMLIKNNNIEDKIFYNNHPNGGIGKKLRGIL